MSLVTTGTHSDTLLTQPNTDSTGYNAVPSQYKMGNTLHVGHTSYAVWSANWIGWQEQIKDKRFSHVEFPSAEYLLLEVTVRNNDKRPQRVPDFFLVDENDAEYETSSHEVNLEDGFRTFERLNPGVSKNVLVLFDVPKNHRYRLKLLGGNNDPKYLVVDLSPNDAGLKIDTIANSKSPEKTPDIALRRTTAESDSNVGDRKQVEQDAAISGVESDAPFVHDIEDQKAKAIDDAKWRTWTAKVGEKKAEAKFKSYANGKVTLEKTRRLNYYVTYRHAN